MVLSGERQDRIFYTGAGLLALVMVPFLGMLIAIVALGLFVPTIKPLRLPQWLEIDFRYPESAVGFLGLYNDIDEQPEQAANIGAAEITAWRCRA